MKIKIWVLLFIGALSLSAHSFQFEKNVPVDVRQQLIKDLNFLYSIKGSGSTQLHMDIFGPVDGANYKNYLESKLKTIAFGECGGGKSVACANAIEDDKIYLTKRFANLNISPLIRLFTIFHEVRHLDGNSMNWPHEGCPSPFLGENGKNVVGILTGEKMEGEDACDWSVYGAYGSTAILLKNIALFCVNCSPEIKAEAHYLAYDQMKRVVDKFSYNLMLEDYLKTDKSDK